MKIAYNSIDGLVVQEMETTPEYEHIVITDEIQKSINSMFKPTLSDGIIIESATEQEIADFNKSQVSQTASKMRFFLALLDMNITRSMVYDVINQIPDATLKEIVLIKFDLSQEFDRNDDHLIMLANQFNITEDQLDNLFIQANE